MNIEIRKLTKVKLLEEFKTFALKGNMIDLAVAVIIGAAFGAVVKSLVDHIIMPLLSYVAPGKEGPGAWTEIDFNSPLATRLRKDWSYLGVA